MTLMMRVFVHCAICGASVAQWAHYPISLEGKWDFEVVRFSVHYYYYTCS